MTMEIKFLGYQTIGDHTEFALQVRAFSPLLPVLWCDARPCFAGVVQRHGVVDI